MQATSSSDGVERSMVSYEHSNLTVPPASHVRFASGAVHLMTTSALERTLDADDGLRDRLGLPPVEPPDGS